MTAGDLDPRAFEVRRADLGEGIELAYVREGVGGVPLVLVHGWPSTKRLFWRNIRPLAEAGFEVIAADVRGFGDSSIPPGGPLDYADPAASGRDLVRLLAELGHERAVLAGGDFGSGVVQDVALRFPDLVIRQTLWNGLSPHLPEQYAAAGIPGSQLEEVAAVSEHLERHGLEADALAAKLGADAARVAYVRSFYTGRAWKPGEAERPLAAPGAFDAAAAAFHAEPFAVADVFRASLGIYEAIMQPQLLSEPPLLAQPNQETETQVLYGIADQIVGPNFVRRAKVAYGNLVGPFMVQDAGHFLPWEQPAVFNSALVSFCRDLL